MEHKKLLAGIGATSMALVLLAGVGFGGVVSADAENTGSGQKPAVGYYLAEESRQALADNGLMATDFSYFDGLRYTATGQGGAADSNWWGLHSVYMGLSADGSSVDLTQYASVNYELWGVSQDANWASLGLIDADGNYVYASAKQNSGNCLFDGTRYGAGENGADLQVTDYKDPSSDWRGAFVGNMWGEVKALLTPYDTTSFRDDVGDVGTFQMGQVVAAFIQYHAYDTKTIQSGKVTLVKADGTRETVFNPSNATATEYTDNITTLTGLNVLTNKQWHFGPQPSQIKAGHTRSEMIEASTAFALTYAPYVERPSTDPAVWDINKVKNGGDVWGKAVEYDEATDSYVTARPSIDEHDGIVLDIDTTGLISPFVQIDLCLTLRIDGVERIFKAFANKVNATYVFEDGTKKTNADLEKGANLIPQGFKAKLYVPFGAFEEGDEIKLTDINNFGDYTEHLYLIFVNSSFVIGDKMKIRSTYTYDCEEHVDANKDLVCDFCETSGIQNDGASIRYYQENVDDGGIRFRFSIQKWLYEALPDTATVGVLMIPKDLAPSGLSVDTAKVLNITADWTYDESTGTYVALVTLYKIPSASYSRLILARVYVSVTESNGNTEIFYGDTVTRSIAYVAQKAYKDEQTTETQRGKLLPYLPVVTLDCGEGSGEFKTETLTVTLDGSPAYTLPTAESCSFTAPEGKVFSGWSLNGTIYQPGDSVSIHGNCTFTAIYGT